MKNDLIKTEMDVKNNKVGIMRIGNVDYISLTDLAKYANSEDPSGVIRNWMSNKNSFVFYSLWEELNNPNFNSVESHGIKINEVPYNRFTMTPNRWKKDFNAISIVPSSGKYSKGTFAQPFNNELGNDSDYPLLNMNKHEYINFKKLVEEKG